MGKREDINYKLPSGFDIELLPGERRLELFLLESIGNVFERYGFTPLETPAVERLEVLQAKGNQGDNIIYSIEPIVPQDMGDSNESSDGSSRGLKFDQTVPLAAYIARHLNDLTFPFARYQMDMVFRGERAKKGRYRQFRQCDIDVVGRGSLDLLYDAQMPAIIAEIFDSIDIGKFLIRINNRKVLTGFFKGIGIEKDKIKTCINIVDILEKVGSSKVKKELEKEGISENIADEIIEFINIKGGSEEIFATLDRKSTELKESEDFLVGIKELKAVIKGVRSLKVSEDKYCIDLSIARGLDYYTGTVYETTLVGYENLGSICSGGRYEELVGTFVGDKLPGVGISIGLTRLMSKLMDANILKPMSASPAQVMVLNLDRDLIDTYLEISQNLRQAGIKVVTRFEKQKIGKQIQQADRLGIPLCLLIGKEEYTQNQCRIKILNTGEQLDISLENLVEEVRKILNNQS